MLCKGLWAKKKVIYGNLRRLLRAFSRYTNIKKSQYNVFHYQVKLRLVLPSMLYQESNDGGSSPILKSIVGLNSPVTMDQSVFQLTLMARIVQILLCTSPDLPGKKKRVVWLY